MILTFKTVLNELMSLSKAVAGVVKLHTQCSEENCDQRYFFSG